MPTQTWSCPFRKLNPTVLMVKSPQDVASDDAAAALNGSAMWGICRPTAQLKRWMAKPVWPTQFNSNGIWLDDLHGLDSGR